MCTLNALVSMMKIYGNMYWYLAFLVENKWKKRNEKRNEDRLYKRWLIYHRGNTLKMYREYKK